MLWLFSDPARLADPLAALRALPRALPRGLLGVVLRQDREATGGLAGRIAKGRAVAALCRARGVALAVACDRNGGQGEDLSLIHIPSPRDTERCRMPSSA